LEEIFNKKLGKDSGNLQSIILSQHRSFFFFY